MTTDPLALTRQTTLVLPIILDGYASREAAELLADTIELLNRLEKARDQVLVETRDRERAGFYVAATMPPLRLAIQMGAIDLVTITRRLHEKLSDMDPESSIGGDGAADILAWTTIADQTMIALRLLFQVAHLYGRAPNGKRLLPGETSPEDS